MKKLLLLDADVVIDLHTFGVFDRISRGFDIHITKTVLDEAQYYKSGGTKRRIQISDCVTVIEDVALAHLQTVRNEAKQARLGIDPGEQEYDYSPNGVLSLRIKNDDSLNTRKTWSDGRRQRLEDCLNSFVGGLIKAAIAIKHLRAEQERRELKWQEERRQREESERIRREEEEKLKVLDREVASW